MKTPRFATFLLSFSMFATGACGLVSEYILSTVSTYMLGNSIEQFSIVIALMMFMMGFAGWVQRFVKDDGLIEKFIYLEIGLAILGGFAPLIIYAAFGFVHDHFMLIHYSMVAAIGFLIGFEIPLLLRINEAYSINLGTNMSRILSADYVGSFVGALVWSFYLLKRFPLTEISFIMAMFNFFVATITFFYFMKHKIIKKSVIPLLLILSCASLLGGGYLKNRSWSLSLEQRFYEDKILFSKTTKYQRLVMTWNRTMNEYRFYINGNLQFSSLDENIYHEQLVQPVMHLAPEKREVLILGGGDGMALREVLKHPEVESVTLVDLDPEMTKFSKESEILAKMNRNAFKDARVVSLPAEGVRFEGNRNLYMEKDGKSKTVGQVKILNIDADRFFERVRDRYDVVIVDFPDPSSVELAKLYSREFYLKLKNVMRAHTLVAIQATSPYHAKATYRCIRDTLEAAEFNTLAYHDNVPSFGEWGWFLAWRGDLPIKEKIEKMEFNVPTTYLTPELFRAATVFGKGALEGEKRVNTLLDPVILRTYLDESWLVD